MAQLHTEVPGVYGVRDSVVVTAHSSYNKVGGIHKFFFGNNYRREWGTLVKVPLIRISEVQGGLKPIREGGGMQSKSLRLIDKEGKEWVIRSVKKTPEKLLPPNLKGTFAVTWMDDALSSQHPFSALVVPPIADAAKVPHANPVIGVLEPDAALGEYSKAFSGLLVLLEEREPAGESDNTIKMLNAIKDGYESRFNGELFLRARMLDLLLGDWDRHEDQWRWAYEKKGDRKIYYPVPRDRDQVFHVNEGLIPSLAAVSWIIPTLGHFDSGIPRVKYSLFKSRFLQALPDAQFTHAEWMRITKEFVEAQSDEVLEAGLRRLPKEVYHFGHNALLRKLKHRRNQIPAAMDSYYRFINETIDLRTSDNDELIVISDAVDNGMRIQINKLNKAGVTKGQLLDMVYDPDFTREIRIYVEHGKDKVIINNRNSPIKIRVIGAGGEKTYEVRESAKRVQVYNRRDSVYFEDDAGRLSKHLSNNARNTKFVPNNPYNVIMPLATAAINPDDGFLFGAGFKYTRREGFRKQPYSSVQQLMVGHSFSTDAFRIRYTSEWIDAIHNADFTINALVQAPNNTLNFFGRGNETMIDKFPDYRRYYRIRYNTYHLVPAVRWNLGEATIISTGPSIQYYKLRTGDNVGRFINNRSKLNSYDSLMVDKEKAHLGLLVNLVSNKRNNNILPTSGYNLDVSIQGYTGLNQYSRTYFQVRPEFTYYLSLNARGSIVLSDRVGGGLSFGKPGFYQSMFLGGQGNLLGYLQNRFAGDHMLYNNLQARLKLLDVISYILPGQFGITGLYDIGRVWVRGEASDKWHTGAGGGLYFSPAGLSLVQLLVSHSKEGWYPYVSLSVRL